MKCFNTRLYSSLTGLLALLILCTSNPMFGQDVTTTEEPATHHVKVKKIIITEDGETKVIEHKVETDGKIADFSDEEGIIIINGVKSPNTRVEVLTDVNVVNGIAKMDCDRSAASPFIAPFFGHREPVTSKLDVVRLKEGELLPDHIVESIIEMGLDPDVVQQQFDEAENMVYISKVGEGAALIEVDGPQPASMRGFSPEGNQFFYAPEIPQNLQGKLYQDFDFDFDFDFDIDVEATPEDNSAFRFNFNGNLPENIFEHLEENDINFEKLEDGSLKIIAPEGFENLDISIIEDNGENSFKLFFEGDLEDLKQLEGLENLEKPEFFENFSFGNNMDCDNKDPKPMLGVYLGETTEQGITVDKVIEGSAAEEGGLQEGDVITAINSNPVKNSEELVDQIQANDVGDAITVSYIRDGSPATTQTVLKGKSATNNYFKVRPDHDHEEEENHFHYDYNYNYNYNYDYNYNFHLDCAILCEAPFLGVWIENSHDEEGNVQITGIFEETGAEKAGLQEDDYLLAIDGETFSGTDAVIEKVQSYEPGEEVEVTYLRDGQRQTVTAVISRKSDAKRYSDCDCDNLEAVEPVEKQEIIILKEREDEFVEEVIPVVPEEPTEEEVASPVPPVNQSPSIERTLQLRSFSLFPNPNAGDFSINFRAETPGPLTITVTDVNGREVYRENVPDFQGSYYQDINISQYGAGIYFLSIIQADKIWTERFVFSND